MDINKEVKSLIMGEFCMIRWVRFMMVGHSWWVRFMMVGHSWSIINF